jgi:hypothetical protein
VSISDKIGINIVTYYAPTLFKESLGMSQERSLLLGCFLQLFYIIASFVTVSPISPFMIVSEPPISQVPRLTNYSGGRLIELVDENSSSPMQLACASS